MRFASWVGKEDWVNASWFLLNGTEVPVFTESVLRFSECLFQAVISPSIRLRQPEFDGTSTQTVLDSSPNRWENLKNTLHLIAGS